MMMRSRVSHKASTLMLLPLAAGGHAALIGDSNDDGGKGDEKEDGVPAPESSSSFTASRQAQTSPRLSDLKAQLLFASRDEEAGEKGDDDGGLRPRPAKDSMRPSSAGSTKKWLPTAVSVAPFNANCTLRSPIALNSVSSSKASSIGMDAGSSLSADSKTARKRPKLAACCCGSTAASPSEGKAWLRTSSMSCA